MVIRPYQPTADTLNPKEYLANISIEKCHMVQINAADQITFPPRDLWSEEPPLASDRHLKQLILLLTCLERLWSNRTDFFDGVNMGSLGRRWKISQFCFRGFIRFHR